ncbi:MAG: hypothetical protein IT436_04950 [Phycisphaerales bacterium]|nr:hypothetical protein [Phycisphaerales bacterium]
MTTPPESSSSGDPHLPAPDFRLLRLEEAHGFLERQVEQLNAEVTRASRTISELARRLDRLEAGPAPLPDIPPAAATLAQAERQVIADALSRAAGGLDQAAQLLAIDRAALERKLIQHGLA